MAARDTVCVPRNTRPHLHRGLKVLGTLLITLSAITPASSVFIIAPGVITQAGTGAFWAYVAAGVVGVFMAFVYAELASAYPLSGGEYAIVARTFGKLPGFVVLGLLLITQLLIIAVIALGVGTYLAVLFPHLHPPTTAAVITVLATALGVFNIKMNAWITGVFPRDRDVGAGRGGGARSAAPAAFARGPGDQPGGRR